MRCAVDIFGNSPGTGAKEERGDRSNQRWGHQSPGHQHNVNARYMSMICFPPRARRAPRIRSLRRHSVS